MTRIFKDFIDSGGTPKGPLRFVVKDVKHGHVFFDEEKIGVLAQCVEVSGVHEGVMYLVFPNGHTRSGHSQATERKLAILLGMAELQTLSAESESDDVLCVKIADHLQGLEFWGKFDDEGFINPIADANS